MAEDEWEMDNRPVGNVALTPSCEGVVNRAPGGAPALGPSEPSARPVAWRTGDRARATWGLVNSLLPASLFLVPVLAGLRKLKDAFHQLLSLGFRLSPVCSFLA